jgi:hypothetical protein
MTRNFLRPRVVIGGVRRSWLLGLGLCLVGSVAACDSGSSDSAGNSPSDTSTTTHGIAVGSLRLDLVEYPVFQEGFDYGVRLEVDGTVTEERLLSEFDGGDQERVQDATWSAEFEVPVGDVAVLSDLTIGPAGPPPPPEFSDPCRTEVTVGAGSETRLVLNWTTGCVEVVD